MDVCGRLCLTSVTDALGTACMCVNSEFSSAFVSKYAFLLDLPLKNGWGSAVALHCTTVKRNFYLCKSKHAYLPYGDAYRAIQMYII